jgi:hypothetical protein
MNILEKKVQQQGQTILELESRIAGSPGASENKILEEQHKV